MLFLFFFNDTATTEIYTLSLHDALPISDHSAPVVTFEVTYQVGSRNEVTGTTGATHILEHMMFKGSDAFNDARSEEHTSELQSLTNLVCRLLLEIKRAHV